MIGGRKKDAAQFCLACTGTKDRPHIYPSQTLESARTVADDDRIEFLGEFGPRLLELAVRHRPGFALAMVLHAEHLGAKEGVLCQASVRSVRL